MAIYGSLGDLEVNADYPSIQPTLDLNFAKTKALDPRITFYRNSLATYTDDKGIIRTVPENVPRFDHNPTTGESLGLLIEESRTNIALYSEQFDNASWDKTTYSCSITSNQLSSPSNELTADLISSTTSNSRHAVVQPVSGATQGTVYSMSIYVKSGTQRYIVFGDQGDSVWRVITFDFNTKTIVNQSSVTSSSVTDVGNGWYKVSITATRSAVGGNYSLFVGFSNSSTNTDIPTYVGSTSDNFYIWGAQIELGAFATSYIPTTTASVTRAVDVCYIDGTNFSNWYNSVEGSYFIDFNLKNTSISDIVILSSPVTSGRYPWLLYRYSPDDYWKYYNAVNGVTNISTGTTFSSQNKFCISYSSSQGSVSKDGILTLSNNSDISVGSGINASNIRIFSGSNTNEFPTSGTIKRVTYYPKRLTNTQLQNLTA